jgi:O-antigen/teichoic acid export membrane protein
MTIPLTMACVVFADDFVSVLLGPKWMDAVVIFRLLAPTILIFAVINPMGWLLLSLGLVRRSLNIALVFAPTLVAGYFIGLHYGPKGVAFAYSTVMALWVIPFIAWCVKGTVVAFWDVFLAVIRPLGFGFVAGVLGFATQRAMGTFVAPAPRLILETGVLLGAFFGLLFFVGGQKTFYLDLIRGLRKPSLATE